MKHLHQKKVLVLGLGTSGLALARWCARWGAQVTVADTRSSPPQLHALLQDLPLVGFVCGDLAPPLLDSGDFELVLKSPGLAPAEIAPLVQAAQTRGLTLGNELSLFAQALKELAESQAYAPRVIAITGTNGKTTVTALTGQLVQRSGKTVAVAGNIGPSLLDTLLERLDSGNLPEVWVLELSSFQLDQVEGFEPSAATVLNLSQDHLDWHGSMPAYVAAKARIYGPHGLMLLNRNDAQVMAALPPLVKGKPARAYQTFGSDEPQRPGDYGIETVKGMTWLVRAAEADETVRRRKNEELPLHIQRLMPVDALRIKGRHNATNALAALGLAVACGCSMAPLLHGLRDYRGEPHRLESIAVVQEVEYFDDSKGTNVGATVAALTGLGEGANESGASGSGRKLILILGGEGKGQDFSPLAAPIARYVRAVVLLGRDAPLIRLAIEPSGVELLSAASMQEAVEMAASRARAGDAVLMSPACASFDMFDNYKHRAEVFCQAVSALGHDAGALL